MSGQWPGLHEWLIYGERGVSSEAIVATITASGVRRLGWRTNPADPADFRRCELLLNACPSLRAEMHRMADVSPEWAALVAWWDDIRAAMDTEVPGWLGGWKGDATEAYRIMRECIDGARHGRG